MLALALARDVRLGGGNKTAASPLPRLQLDVVLELLVALVQLRQTRHQLRAF